MDVSHGRIVVVPAFTIYTAALSLKNVRALGPPGGSRGDELLFCSFGCPPVFPMGDLLCSGSLRRVSFLESWASRPRAPFQEPADRVRFDGPAETRGSDTRTS